MTIITDREQCESFVEPLNESILNAHYYKHLLNTNHQPDKYLFFELDGHIVPLVSKNGLVTFYGGTRHNVANRLDVPQQLINDALSYLEREGYRFQLTSILNDVFPLISHKHQSFDVPYTVEWHYQNVRNYHTDLLLEGCTGKKLWSWKRVIRNTDSYTFETLDFEEFTNRFESLMAAHNAYFSGREKTSVWSGTESLLLKVLTEFHRRHQMMIRLILYEGKPSAIYTLVHSKSEMIYYFGGSMSLGDHYISKVMYLDLLEQSRLIATAPGSCINSLNGLAGAFTNKPVFGFKPKPLYALVHDPRWTIRLDPDVEPDLYYQTYGRSFGCEQTK